MKLLILFVFATLSCSLQGQNNTFIGLEGGLSFDRMEIVDFGNQLRSIPLLSNSGGITLTHDFGKYLSLETGVLLKSYQKGYAFDIIGGPGGITHHGNGIIQIPLRFKTRLALISDKLFLVPTIGYHMCFTRYDNSGSVNVRTGGDGPVFEAFENYNGGLANRFALLETGIGLELKVLKNARLTFSASYFTGFTRLTQGDIVYHVNNEQPGTRATVFSNGDYLSFNVGLKVPLNKFWPFSK